MRKSFYLAILAVALIFCITTTAFAVEYRVTELFYDGNAVAADINDYGQIVCCGSNSGVLWENGGINFNFYDCDGGYCLPLAINNRGQVVGQDPFVWDALSDTSIVHRLPSFGLPPSGLDYAMDINEAGQIVGRVSNQAVIWENGEIRPLTSGVSAANGINDQGQVAGFISGDSGFRPCVWDNGVATYLSEQNGIASAINNRGQVAGAIEIEPGKHKVVMWDNGVMYDTGMRIDNGAMMIGINDLGQVIGYTTDRSGFSGPQQACVWQDGQLTMLPDLGGKYSSAWGINNLGQIVGVAVDDRNYQYAVLWEPVPEPSSILALLSGLGGLGFVLRRRSGRV